MDLAVRILGGPAAIVYETYPTPAPPRGLGGDPCNPRAPITATAAQIGITWDIDGDQIVGDEQLLLKFDFEGGAGTDINAFEGTLEYPTLGKFYAVWPSLVATSPCEMLLQVRNHPLQEDTPGPPVVQCWVEYFGNEDDPRQWQCIRIDDDPSKPLFEEAFPGCGSCP